MSEEGTDRAAESTWRCKVCGREFESEDALREHVESIGLVR
jgi:transposase-like protein